MLNTDFEILINVGFIIQTLSEISLRKYKHGRFKLFYLLS